MENFYNDYVCESCRSIVPIPEGSGFRVEIKGNQRTVWRIMPGRTLPDFKSPEKSILHTCTGIVPDELMMAAQAQAASLLKVLKMIGSEDRRMEVLGVLSANLHIHFTGCGGNNPDCQCERDE